MARLFLYSFSINLYFKENHISKTRIKYSTWMGAQTASGINTNYNHFLSHISEKLNTHHYSRVIESDI